MNDYIPVAQSSFSYIFNLPALTHKEYNLANEAMVQISNLVEDWYDAKFNK